MKQAILVLFVLSFICQVAQAQINCTNPVIDCSARGQCVSPTQCICDDNYITFNPSGAVQCNYKQQLILEPWLLHFFFGGLTGVGCFMLNQINYAVTQVVVFWGGCVFLGVLLGSGARELAICFTCMLAAVILALQVTTLVYIGTGHFTDENGAPLGSWQ